MYIYDQSLDLVHWIEESCWSQLIFDLVIADLAQVSLGVALWVQAHVRVGQIRLVHTGTSPVGCPWSKVAPWHTHPVSLNATTARTERSK